MDPCVVAHPSYAKVIVCAIALKFVRLGSQMNAGMTLEVFVLVKLAQNLEQHKKGSTTSCFKALNVGIYHFCDKRCGILPIS